MPRLRSVVVNLAVLLFLAVTALADEPKWKQHAINPKSEFEAAAAFDVDNDGKLDIVSGATWYRAPDWKPYPVRDVARVGTYYNDFATLPLDVNGDGKTDFITCSYFGRDVGWVENPASAGDKWTYHELDVPGNIEAAWMVDLSGDGVPDVLPNTVSVVVWYEVKKAVSGSVELKKHDFGKEAAGHGVGSGDVNGDGRTDLLTPKGWFEAPADAARDPWAWHADWQLGGTGIQILARDVDGDGLSDIVYGMGHNYGLYCLRQSKGSGGERAWSKQVIDGALAQVHTLLWADIDGDGKAHELVTGKRVYAHEVEPGATDGSVIAWYDVRQQVKELGQARDLPGRAGKERTRRSRQAAGSQRFPTGNRGHWSSTHGHRYRSRWRYRPGLPRQERALSLREPARIEVSKTAWRRSGFSLTPSVAPKDRQAKA